MVLLFSWLSSLILVAISWIMAKVQARYAMPLEWSLSYRFLLSGLILYFCYLTYNCFTKKKIRKLLKIEYKLFIIIGIFQSFLQFLAIYYASRYVSSGLLACIYGLSPIINIIINTIYDKRVNMIQYAILSLLSVIGIFMIFHEEIMDKNNHSITGILIGLCAMMLNAIVNKYIEICSSQSKEDINIYKVLCNAKILAGILFVITALLKNNFTITLPKIEFAYLGSLLYLIIGVSVISQLLNFYIIKYSNSLIVAYQTLGIIILSVIISFFFENLHLTYSTLIGITLLLISIIIGLKKIAYATN